jgi:DNA polymerase-3 subunit epsilon
MINLTIEEATFTVVDLETTGLNPKTSEIIEIAAIKVEGNVITERFHTLVKPSIGFIPEHITKLTGITNPLVIDKPKIEQVFPHFLEFTKNSIIIAHNAKFDISFLNEASFQLTGKLIQNPVICTLVLANRLFSDLKSKSLTNLAYHFNILIILTFLTIENTELWQMQKLLMSFLKSLLIIFKAIKLIKLLI